MGINRKVNFYGAFGLGVVDESWSDEKIQAILDSIPSSLTVAEVREMVAAKLKPRKPVKVWEPEEFAAEVDSFVDDEGEEEYGK